MSADFASLRELRLREPMGERMVSLPCRLGSSSGDDVIVPGQHGSATLLLHVLDGQLGITAAGSGAVFNGESLPAAEFVALRPCDVMAFGDARLIFDDLPAGPTLELRHLIGNETVVPAAVASVRDLVETVNDERVAVASLVLPDSPQHTNDGSRAAPWSGWNQPMLAAAARVKSSP